MSPGNRGGPMELDHVIVCVAGPEAVASLLPGFVLDQGIRHGGQGTRNRRVFFPSNYVEILWVEDAEARRRSGLGGAARWAPGAPCPFGVVLRGTVGEPDRERVRALPSTVGRPSAAAARCRTGRPEATLRGGSGGRGRASAPGHPAAPERRPGYPTRAVAQPDCPRAWCGLPARCSLRARAGAAAAGVGRAGGPVGVLRPLVISQPPRPPPRRVHCGGAGVPRNGRAARCHGSSAGPSITRMPSCSAISPSMSCTVTVSASGMILLSTCPPAMRSVTSTNSWV